MVVPTEFYKHKRSIKRFPCKILTETSPRLQRSHHDVCEWLNLSEITARFPPSRRDLAEIAEIFLRLQRSHQDCQYLAKIVEISPWCLWVSESRWDCSEISSILPKLQKSCHDVCEFLESRWNHCKIFYILPRLARSHQDCRDLSQNFAEV